MAIELAPGSASHDVLERVLDMGNVIESDHDSLSRLDLVTLEARVAVAVGDTHSKYASSKSRRHNPEDDDTDGGEGSSGVPAIVETALKSRRRPPST